MTDKHLSLRYGQTEVLIRAVQSSNNEQQLFNLNDVLRYFNPKNIQNPNVYLRTISDERKRSFNLYTRQAVGTFVNEDGVKWFWQKLTEAVLNSESQGNNNYYVYAIGATKQRVSLGLMDRLVKFGISKNVEVRLANLQKSNPFPLEVIHSINVGVSKKKAVAIESNILSNHTSPCVLVGEWIYVETTERNRYARAMLNNFTMGSTD